MPYRKILWYRKRLLDSWEQEQRAVSGKRADSDDGTMSFDEMADKGLNKKA